MENRRHDFMEVLFIIYRHIIKDEQNSYDKDLRISEKQQRRTRSRIFCCLSHPISQFPLVASSTPTLAVSVYSDDCKIKNFKINQWKSEKYGFVILKVCM